MYIVSIRLQKGFANIGTVVVFQPLVGNSGVVGNLTINGIFYVIKITGHGKIVNILNCHAFIIRLASINGIYNFLFKYNRIIFGNFNNIGVFIYYMHLSGIASAPYSNNNVQYML